METIIELEVEHDDPLTLLATSFFFGAVKLDISVIWFKAIIVMIAFS